ncbi:MAG: AAA family ATPase [Candidatus Paceibacterota bacterium]|jgi:shikimate kinase
MKKLKKSSKNKPFKVVVIYGAPAVGKFTVAKELAKNIDFKIFHNHDVRDFVWKFFARRTPESDVLVEEISFLIFKQIAENYLDTILTHTHSTQFVSFTGLTNVGFYKKIEKIIKKHGGEMLYVQLVASPATILKRTNHPHRKVFKKLTDVKIMKQALEEKDWFTPAKLDNQIVIDNTELSPAKVAQIIKKHFKL